MCVLTFVSLGLFLVLPPVVLNQVGHRCLLAPCHISQTIVVSGHLAATSNKQISRTNWPGKKKLLDTDKRYCVQPCSVSLIVLRRLGCSGLGCAVCRQLTRFFILIANSSKNKIRRIGKCHMPRMNTVKDGRTHVVVCMEWESEIGVWFLISNSFW